MKQNLFILRHGIAVANGILTVEDEAQALARIDKGAECARVAVEMARLARTLRGEQAA